MSKRTLIELTGQRFDRLLVVGIDPLRRKGQTYWFVRCDCGTEKSVNGIGLRDGRTRSCGCEVRKNLSKLRTTHGMYGTPIYKCWQGMKNRCQNPRDHNFQKYGAKGITVCERWKTFENFMQDMGPMPSPKHTVDRKDNSKGYGPDNCKWSTKAEQNRNYSRNRFIFFRGKLRPLIEVVELTGVPRHWIYRPTKVGLFWEKVKELDHETC